MAGRIAVVGAGAIGGYAGGHMARAGHELVVKLWTGVRREAGLGEDNVAQLEPRQSRKAP